MSQNDSTNLQIFEGEKKLRAMIESYILMKLQSNRDFP